MFKYLFLFCIVFLNASIAQADFFVNEHDKPCINKVINDEKYNLLEANFPKNATTSERYANLKKVTDEERVLFLSILKEFESCRASVKNLVSNTDYEVQLINESMFNKYVDLVTRFCNREFTYSEYRKKIDSELNTHQQIMNRRANELAQIEHTNKLYAQQQQDDADQSFWRFLGLTLQNTSERLKQSNEYRPEIRTTCSTIGGKVYCRSR